MNELNDLYVFLDGGHSLHSSSHRVSARLDEDNRLKSTIYDLHIGVHDRVAATDLLAKQGHP